MNPLQRIEALEKRIKALESLSLHEMAADYSSAKEQAAKWEAENYSSAKEQAAKWKAENKPSDKPFAVVGQFQPDTHTMELQEVFKTVTEEEKK